MTTQEIKSPRGNGPFKVVIVGGSIAGLTLAHCLDRAGIDYVILERRKDVAPQEGASIGIMPNGARILEQLGLYSELEAAVHPLETAHITYPDGFCYQSYFPTLISERFGFPLAFLDRQKVLEHLSGSLADASRLHCSKTVHRVEQRENNIRVHTTDGAYFDGDLVVGADGVHSTIRTEMLRLAEKRKTLAQSLSSITVEYGCIFGISKPHPNLKAGQQISCYNDGWSILSVIGKNGHIYWFLFFRLDQRYSYSDAPRFSSSEGAKQCETFASEPYWQQITFGEVWERRETFNTTVLDEYVLSRWHWGRIVCLGDSVHKIAPHTGQGANCAMEDAAALCNILQPFAKSGPPSQVHLDGLLRAFVSDRRRRMEQIANISRISMRIQAREGLVKLIVGRYIFPYAGDIPANKASHGIADAPMLAFLPAPQRSGTGWNEFGSKTNGRKGILITVLMLVFGVLLCLKIR
ncbi:hypothetical protein N7466_007081 [Penicillium verhagenii]|uniref:uncharacterized protein n=1 Tax=Penicillium verhagenii TaxID=1562060 RepID=UPI0025451334|nr:uncharacterized protein N7466_007081 [Penicillium verhagenii]KAJ5928125.1 hypothetical protein N7466_007081 [Penicillium verhagenii]